MIRKLGVVLLVLCLAFTTSAVAQVIYPTLEEYEQISGNKIQKFQEAPMLRTKVAAGELPPLEERLTEDAMVVEPEKEIGIYGGTLYITTQHGPTGWHIKHTWLYEPHILRTPDLEYTYPNLIKGYEFSDDGKTVTMFLRKGLKWSDGYPATADDVMFFWEGIIGSDELFAAKPFAFIVAGELAHVEKIDDYTVSFQFAAPHSKFMHIWPRVDLYAPKHFLEKYHIKYNPEANELAKEEGLDHWYQLLIRLLWIRNVVGVPTLEPWVLKSLTTTDALYERNPYYWKIDTAGNQLPYIDRMAVKQIANPEAYKMSVITGETDFALFYLTLEDYPLVKKNEQKGDYEVRLWNQNYNGAVLYNIYQSHEDPVIRKILQDVRFRQALSLALDRNEINELIFFGKGTPSQFALPPTSKYYVPETWQAYAQYDPEEANRLLDEMGLKWNKEHTYRLRPDDKTLSLKIEGSPIQQTPTLATAELAKDYWEAIGIKVDFDFSSNELFSSRMRANKIHILTQAGDRAPDENFTGSIIGSNEWWSKPWWDGWQKGQRAGALEAGASEDAIRVYELREEFLSLESEEERIRVAKEISLLLSKNLWVIGTVGGAIPVPAVVKNYLRNVPEVSNGTIYCYWQLGSIPAQFFLMK